MRGVWVFVVVVVFYFFFFFFLLESCYASSTDYPHCYLFTDDPHFQICWKVGQEDIKIQFDMTFTNRWFSLGIGEPTSGSMPGADMVTIEWEGDKLKVVDRYSLEFGFPEEDICQDWILDGYDINDGINTVVRMHRKLDTQDIQDRSITAGDIRILWAIGNAEGLMYHGASRGVGVINFLNPTPPSETPGETWEFRMDNVEIPSRTTNYMCASMTLPEIEDGHVIRVEALIDPTAESAKMVHHFLVYICSRGVNGSWEEFQTPQRCNNGADLGTPASGCTTPFFAWAVGTGPLILPPEAGIRMGSAKDYALRYAVIQVHYDNAALRTGIRDNSGIKITYTTDLRPNDAGVLNFGDPFTNLPSIAAGLHPENPAAWFQVNCPSQCTNKWTHDIFVFADGLHMHQVGSRIWVTEWTANNSLVGAFNSALYYQFAMQQITYHNPPRKITRGNRLNLNCVYDTSGRTKETHFAGGSDDEMCMQFLFYYPLLMAPNNPTRPFHVCGYVYLPQLGMTQNGTVCGDVQPEDMLPVTNPSVADPRALGDSPFGKDPGQCQSDSPNDPDLPHSGDSDDTGTAASYEYWDGFIAGSAVSMAVFIAITILAGIAVAIYVHRKHRYAIVRDTAATSQLQQL